ncbi:spore germination lipoprotein GerD [Edaphobacillus lindanitolerans]|uniref:Spore germination protein D n=1 Tax=Edaphobacillus lindanitolerans TaxID=550447 RepID=A0A1U7PLL0_9BACI|nr:spore germination protein D [Edaphobacillus lindanitolerans]
MMRVKRLLPAGLVLLVLSGCAGPATPSYEETKKMMTDALQTEDGKKAIRQLLSDPQFKDLLVLEQEDVKTSIEETMLSDKGKEFWKEQFDDPKFKETIAKSMKDQQEDVMKKLMSDPSFQKQLEDFFGQAEMQKNLGNAMKSTDMREEIKKIVEETIDSPLLAPKWQEMVKKAGESGGNEGGGKKDEKTGKDKEESDPEKEKGPGGGSGQ